MSISFPNRLRAIYRALYRVVASDDAAGSEGTMATRLYWFVVLNGEHALACRHVTRATAESVADKYRAFGNAAETVRARHEGAALRAVSQ